MERFNKEMWNSNSIFVNKVLLNSARNIIYLIFFCKRWTTTNFVSLELTVYTLASSRHRGAQLRGGSWGVLPCPFKKSKNVPYFWKKCPDCVHLWVEFFIGNVVLTVCRRKNPKRFPSGVFLSCIFHEMFIKLP